MTITKKQHERLLDILKDQPEISVSWDCGHDSTTISISINDSDLEEALSDTMINCYDLPNARDYSVTGNGIIRLNGRDEIVFDIESFETEWTYEEYSLSKDDVREAAILAEVEDLKKYMVKNVEMTFSTPFDDLNFDLTEVSKNDAYYSGKADIIQKLNEISREFEMASDYVFNKLNKLVDGQLENSEYITLEVTLSSNEVEVKYYFSYYKTESENIFDVIEIEGQ